MSYEHPAGHADSSAMGVIADLLEQRTGQQIAPTRAWRLDAALQPMLRELGMASLDDLVRGLIVARDAALSDQVIDTLLNQETSFFRDATVLDAVVDAACTLHTASPSRRLRMWSAGCSNGQEPLSLAILCEERGLSPEVAEIVATDVSQGAIARAKLARFTQFEIQRGLSVRRMMTWFEDDGPNWSARRQLVRRVNFRQQNLLSDAPPAGGLDIISCRNVLMYFSPELRRAAFARFAQAMRPGGLLVLGASETVIGQTDLFTPSPYWRGLYTVANSRG